MCGTNASTLTWPTNPKDKTLVFEAHRLLYHSTLGLRVIKKKKDKKSQTQTPKQGVVEMDAVSGLVPVAQLLASVRAAWWFAGTLASRTYRMSKYFFSPVTEVRYMRSIS